MADERYIKSQPFGKFELWVEREFEAIERTLNSMTTESPQYATEYDQDADPPTLAYMGWAPPGSSKASAVWRIQKLTFAGDGDVSTTWADGNAKFDNVWNDRASLSYS